MRNFRRMLYLKIARMGRGSNTPVPSIISNGTKIKGNILGGDIVHIDGRLEGNISCNELIIGVKGQVVGQVKAQTLSLYGMLQGTAEVENLFIANTAHLAGDALHNSIAIEPGAFIEGRCVRLQKAAVIADLGKNAVVPSGNIKKAGNESEMLFKAVAGGK